MLTEEDVSRRRKLRTVKSADSLLSASASMREVRTSQGSSGTGVTFMNPYAKSGNFISRIVLAIYFIYQSVRVPHSTWKTFKNDSTSGKPGQILEFCDF